MQRLKPRVHLLSATVLFSALLCGSAAPQAQSASPPDGARMAAGFRALEAACFSCHSPDPGAAQPIAPSMAALRRHYLADHPDYPAFRDAIVAFADDPAADNARLPGAVERFGLMPRLSLDEEVLKDAAYFLYHAELDAPGWFDTRYAARKRRRAGESAPALQTPADYRRHGQQLAMRTKTALGSNLKKALREGGPVHAVGFCKTRANPIADEMSTKLQASIRRVSDRPRNPANAASEVELAYIRQFRDALAAGEKPGAAIRDAGERMVGYYPIVTNGLCLQCHGTVGTDISPATDAVIRREYPADRATGYAENELRGLFVVSMDKPENKED